MSSVTVSVLNWSRQTEVLVESLNDKNREYTDS